MRPTPCFSNPPTRAPSPCASRPCPSSPQASAPAPPGPQRTGRRMADQPGDVLDRARRQATLSQFELWMRYFELGGMDSPLELDGYLLGALQPTTHEHDLLVHALNERFAELGRGHPVPYTDPRITRGDRLA